jgi:hypothetical protein
MSGQSPWRLLRASPLEFDFNNAVMWPLYREEQERTVELVTAAAREIAHEVAREVGRLFLPIWGYELKGSGARSDSPDAEGHPAATVEIVVDGERRTVPTPPPGWVYDEAGRPIELKPTEGRPGDTDCEHINHVPFQGSLKCLDCGSVGN